jgi:hypothetical protein
MSTVVDDQIALAAPAPEKQQSPFGLMEKEETAAGLCITTRTLDEWHRRRIGPPRIRVGGRVLYRKSTVLRWLEKRESKLVRSR